LILFYYSISLCIFLYRKRHFIYKIGIGKFIFSTGLIIKIREQRRNFKMTSFKYMGEFKDEKNLPVRVQEGAVMFKEPDAKKLLL